MRHDQLVRVSLLFRQRRSGLDALGRIWNRTIECSPARPKAKRRHHQARVTEYSLRLIQPLACDATNQTVGIDVDIIESQGRGVAEADAVFVLWFVVRKTLRALFDDEPTRTAGRVGQHRVSAGDSAVADPLFIAVDFVSDHAAILQDRVCRSTKSSQIASGFRFRCAVGEQQPFVRDAAQPEFLLLRRRAYSDRIAAKKGSQHGSCDPEIDPRHLLTNAVDIERPSAHAAELFRNEQELNAQLVGTAHVADDFDGALVALIKFDQDFVG